MLTEIHPVASQVSEMENEQEFATPTTPSSEIEHKYVPTQPLTPITSHNINSSIISAAASASAIDRKPPITTVATGHVSAFQSNLFAGVTGFDETFFSASSAKQEYTSSLSTPMEVKPSVSFKPETSTYYPMNSSMVHSHHLSSPSVVVPQLSSYAVSLGAEGTESLIADGQAYPTIGYGMGLNEAMYISAPSHSQNGLMNSGLAQNSMMAHYSGLGTNQIHGTHMPSASAEYDTDPRELEAFAERFKQRRIKLGVTQADVGQALGKLKIPGVGSLSQSTICRFESLTLSHNNMVALKPILQAWLERAENAAKAKKEADGYTGNEKKRKRTSIAAPEKRSLEAYFTVQPRPSSEKIAAIAEKLDLKKNVVRVWFCNQRQKQKRMKFSAYNQTAQSEY
ncbi:Oidioi.mRNA.OKI2018_I69.XSR.g16161.t2.cds [Oikopleura dioica]|uniref:POU domain protein n=1 Tax=Oikopleura dioica TaxID=34765 RepID=A0ABN7SFQ4_OIKDI|nr:Oidioi.mRNA.OKI2018_I69.XSR.g16161.t2.cds [Oikopleura dioica]